MEELVDELESEPLRDTLRLIGGLLVVVGLLGTAYRNGFGGEADIFTVLLLALAAFGPLGIAVLAADDVLVSRAWLSALAVAGSLVLPLLGYQLIAAISDASISVTNSGILIFGASALVCYAVWRLADLRFEFVLAGLFGVTSLVLLLDKSVLDASSFDFDAGGGLDSFRLVLLAAAAGLIGAAVAVDRMQPPRARELSGDLLLIAGYAAFWVALATYLAGLPLAFILGSIGDLPGGGPFGETPASPINLFWDVAILLLGLTLAWSAARLRQWGPGIFGALLVASAALSIGLDADGVLSGNGSPGLIGFPLLLILLGAAAFVGGLERFGVELDGRDLPFDYEHEDELFEDASPHPPPPGSFPPLPGPGQNPPA